MEKQDRSSESPSKSPKQGPHTHDDQERRWLCQRWWLLPHSLLQQEQLQSEARALRNLPISRLSSYSLGLLLGEMVTSLRMTLGDCCSGGVRQGLSSTSGREVSSSPTSTRSRLPSSIPFPSHRPHGNLEVKQRPVRATHSSSILPCYSAVPATKPIYGTGHKTRLGAPGISLSHSNVHWNYLSGLGHMSINTIHVYSVGNHLDLSNTTRQSQREITRTIKP